MRLTVTIRRSPHETRTLSTPVCVLDVGLINRPSRFDKFFCFDTPNKASRKVFLKNYFPDLTDKELEDFSDSTAKFSGAYFKELFILKNIQKITVKQAIENINEQLEFSKQGKDDSSYMG